jgi:hypothetical protein
MFMGVLSARGEFFRAKSRTATTKYAPIIYYNLNTKQFKTAYIKKYISLYKKILLSSAINKA